MDILQQMGIQRWRIRNKGAPGLSGQESQVSAGRLESDLAKVNLKQAAPTADSDSVLNSEQQDADPRLTVTSVSESGNSDLCYSPASTERKQAPGLDGCSWQDLEELLETGVLCESCKQQNSILGSGDLNADWVFVIDAPIVHDLHNRQLLSGRAGQLFDAILESVGMDRESIYLCSALKCPVTENMRSTAQCGKLVHRQISLIKPKLVLTMGEFAAQTVLRANDDLPSLRSENHRLAESGARVVATFSAPEMLDQPNLKAQVWQDLKKCLMYLSS